MELATSSTNCRTIFSPTTTLACKYPSQVIHSLLSQPVFSPITNRRPISLSFSNMVSNNGYAGQPNRRFSFDTNNSKFYKRLDSCLVIPPLNGKKPRAIIKFLGGAFIGAVPEVTYSYLKELLAKEGFLLISVPYNVTFDHAKAANQVYERFNSCLDTILTTGLAHANLAPTDLVDLPIFSVGHSNGALIQVLIGSYFSEKIPKANAIISFNNRPATEAVPYFEQLGPIVSQMMPIVEASPVYSMARSASDQFFPLYLSAEISLNLFDRYPLIGVLQKGYQSSSQHPLRIGIVLKKSYNVPHTLLVKFSFDTIDDTDLLEETLRPRVESIGGTVEKIQLNGNHITPCVQVTHAKFIFLPFSVWKFFAYILM
ncbi:hypothetical protein Patl1_13725 [Pistacia atlantica]|uniref:Uncharacterized protein n=1 Tax=Pistacia atlantica TaxID=434234 RepID=A0ACC1AS67_9ROSI|nr:hypothetical protein Patl1_13725 [Pistacia atlantica]